MQIIVKVPKRRENGERGSVPLREKKKRRKGGIGGQGHGWWPRRAVTVAQGRRGVGFRKIGPAEIPKNTLVQGRPCASPRRALMHVTQN